MSISRHGFVKLLKQLEVAGNGEVDDASNGLLRLVNGKDLRPWVLYSESDEEAFRLVKPRSNKGGPGSSRGLLLQVCKDFCQLC